MVRALALVLLGLAGPGLAQGLAQDRALAPFEVRSAFVAADERTSEPIAASLAGAAVDDVRQLSLQALGAVDGKKVAVVGAARGEHLRDIASAVGAGGRVFATEVSDEGCEALARVVADGELANVSVVRAEPYDVGLETESVDVVLLSDVFQLVLLREARGAQDEHGFLTSLHRALAPGGEVVVTYVTSSELRDDGMRERLLARTLADFANYGFERGRHWRIDGPHWPVHVLEFRSPASGPKPVEEYLGRRIAQTMHWEGAEWLTRETRDDEEDAARMLDALAVQPGWTVADFGCGNGYHTLELAKRVGTGETGGTVYGVDIQQEMLDMLTARAADADIDNVVPLKGSILSAPLPPASCDLVLLADVYHELSHPVATLAAIRRSLKPDGLVALLEFRAEDPKVPIKRLHKMSKEQVTRELEANGFELARAYDELPWQHLLLFRARR